MSLEGEILKEKAMVIESDLTKDIKEGDQLFLIGRRIYIQPMVERTDSGFIIYGTPIDYLLPYFAIEVDFDKKKVVARVKGETIPSDYKEDIENILLDNF